MERGFDSAELYASTKVPFEDAWRFILKVGVAAHRYGSTSTRLETFLSSLSTRLGYEGVFRSTPSDIVFALREDPGSPQRVEVIATPPPNVDLDKLARLGDLLNELGAGTVSLADASARLDAIAQAPPPWGWFASMLGYAFAGLGLAPLLGGGWSDTLCATLLSMIVYGVVVLSGRLGAAATAWLPFSSAFVAGVLATIAKLWVPELNLVLVILSAVAIILPGYTISLGAMELVAQHVLSGTANLTSGLICLAKQVAGGWLGVAYLGIVAGSSILNDNLGNLVGTIIAVVIANLWARQTGRPTSIVLIPAIVVLVSGSIGFRGLAAMTEGEWLLGVRQFSQMFVVALTIFAGILVGYTIVRPEPSL